ncbi:ABC transporter ATP-binding protein [Marinilongibacter aquaticus]|uniref:ABC transporter ATP-binding protein n=1 Tax=Marinilongibacter aquaticus TaxID=2975157 RepID=UPI0021BD2F51|nr:ABC transporter ATP-binding protein [Marinilongibacter aquaticus]UBM60892.1 ABC transporter ATP-binding protein [Marinilongibacter aquaticus]
MSVEVRNIAKTYEKGTVEALRAVDLSVASGELFGIIGPDGAGKTSLFRILTTLLLPDSGTAKVAGFDVVEDFWEIRKIVGYMPGRFSLYQDLSIQENLHFFATVFNVKVEDNYHLIEDIYVQLAPFKDRLAGKLSGGMKQKLALCCALIHEPKVLFLDEPTTGVDPVSRTEFWDMLDKLKAKGITIVVSTPYMDEASRCDRIALIQKGRILEVESLENILKKHEQPMYAVAGKNRHGLIRAIRDFEKTASCFAFGEENHVTFKDENTPVSALQQYLEQRDFDGLTFKSIKPGIEDVFIKLMLNQSENE